MVNSRRRILEKNKPVHAVPILTIIASILLWPSLLFMIYFTDPTITGIIVFFFLLFFISTFVTISIFFKRTSRKIIISSGVTLFILLRYLKIGNIINFFLLLAVMIIILTYESNIKKSD